MEEYLQVERVRKSQILKSNKTEFQIKLEIRERGHGKLK